MAARERGAGGKEGNRETLRPEVQTGADRGILRSLQTQRSHRGVPRRRLQGRSQRKVHVFQGIVRERAPYL